MKNKWIAFLLVILTLFGTLILPVTAADEEAEYEIATAFAEDNKDPDDPDKKTYSDVTRKLTVEVDLGYTDLYAQTEKYQLFCNKYTGEVYLRDRTTGQYLTTNPIDVGTAQQADKLSQVWMSFKSFEIGSAQVSYNSFNMAAKKGQISVSRIRDGIRVEYTMGDVTSRYLAPQAILDTAFSEKIVRPFQEHILSIVGYDSLRSHFSFLNLPEIEKDENGNWRPVQYDENNNPITYTPEEMERINVYLRLTTVTLMDDPQAFQTVLGNVLGTPSPTLHNRDVCSRFREDYKIVKEKVNKDLQSEDPAVFAAADALREQILEELKVLIPTLQSDAPKLPHESNIGSKLNDVYKDFGNFAVAYNTIVDLNKYYDENGNVTDAAKVAELKKKYKVLDYTLQSGESYPVIRTLGIQPTDTEATLIRKFQKVQKYFTDSVPEYTLTMMLADEEEVGFEAVVFDNPLFRCALEYTLDDTGMTVDVPASSIIFDEAKYQLTELSFLRYFCAGKTEDTATNDGYIFYPDGSGALLYNKTIPTSAVLNQPVYSYDYSFASLSLRDTGDSVSSSQPIRMPVFGAVNNVQTGKDGEGRAIYSHVGYLAIITEGESLARLYTRRLDDGGAYVGAYASYTYRATDNYAIGRLGSGSTISIQADFKYTGFFTQKYVMLTDENLNPDGYGYRADYVGMATAYRDYLFGHGDLATLDAEELQERLPLFFETYATVQSKETILSFPVTLDRPLTSFADVQTIGNELREAGISNVKFRLMGYYNDGYKGYYPNRVKWMKEVGGKKGFKALVNYVAEHEDEGFEAFTDVDLLYNYRLGKIGSISKKKNHVRSMDDRYVRKIVYSTILRASTSKIGILVSASRLSALFNKFDKKFSKFKATAISLAYLASDLSSNFNEDDFFTREQAKGLVVETLKTANEKYTVMATGGNVYTIPYVDYLLSAPVDGSHYNFVSRTVPFFGMVMHGALQYAGEVFNEAGNPDYEILRDIESGAAMYVILVYRNTDLMKEDPNGESVQRFSLSEHYSANYQIWHDDLISYYDVLDYAIGDLQTWKLVDHKFVNGERKVQEDELEEDSKILEEEYVSLLRRQFEDRLIERNKLLRYLWYIDLAPDATERDKRIKTLGQGMLKGNTYGQEAMVRIQEVIEEIRDNYAAGTDEKDIAPDALKKLIDPADPDYTYSTASGQKVKVSFDVEAILADAEAQLNATPSDWLREQVEALKAEYEYEEPDGVLPMTISGVDDYAKKTKNSFVTDSEADDPAYKKTTYTIDDGSIVLVTYSNGTDSVRILLNFSIFTVTVKYGGETYTLGKYDFIRLDPRADGKTDPRTR